MNNEREIAARDADSDTPQQKTDNETTYRSKLSTMDVTNINY